ncbi:MAG: hypothetical protein ACE5E0_03130 [Terriglobia bacterium]
MRELPWQAKALAMLRTMTLISLILGIIAGPGAYMLGGGSVLAGVSIGLGLSLANFYGSVFSLVYAFGRKDEGSFSIGRAAGFILGGFWARLAILGVILLFLARLPQVSMMGTLASFVLFYGILFVGELRFLSGRVREITS